jgi:ribosome-binding factor A
MSRDSRMRRVNEVLREVIAEELERLKDPGLGFVTITGVETAPDLRSSRVYYSVLGDEAQGRETESALQRAASRIRAVIGREIRMKYLPELRFERDPAIERGMRMEQILRQLGEERVEGGDPGEDSQGG